ncbi:alpha/beta hydrolase [Streptomyces sp. 13-12-16]|uniref:alpha/beta hydrolase n=1 Tax=Streptomyces sp. 13-12-16 TaxID=1570823 RepID=UPI00211A3424|nr:alpha/beta hydrolase [Streptomyces sp. 13-12-16]
MPVLVVHDENDEAVEVEWASRLVAAHGQRARLVTTRSFGHRRILGSPRVSAEVAAFVAAGAGLEAGATVR